MSNDVVEKLKEIALVLDDSSDVSLSSREGITTRISTEVAQDIGDIIAFLEESLPIDVSSSTSGDVDLDYTKANAIMTLGSIKDKILDIAQMLNADDDRTVDLVENRNHERKLSEEDIAERLQTIAETLTYDESLSSDAASTVDVSMVSICLLFFCIVIIIFFIIVFTGL